MATRGTNATTHTQRRRDVHRRQTWWDVGSQPEASTTSCCFRARAHDRHDDEQEHAARQALQEYANAGGRVFASHWHNYWIERRARRPGRRSPTSSGRRTDPTSPSRRPSTPPSRRAPRWPSGWSTSVDRRRPASSSSMAPSAPSTRSIMPSQRWIYSMIADVDAVLLVQHAGHPDAAACGRVVFSDLHVSAGDGNRRRRQLAAVEAVPDRLRDDGSERAGKGARVHALRPVVVVRGRAPRRAADQIARSGGADACRCDSGRVARSQSLPRAGVMAVPRTGEAGRLPRSRQPERR